MKALGVLGAVLASTVVYAADPITPDEVTGPFTYGSTDGVKGIRHLRLGGSPDVEGLRAAKEAGVAVVVDLRGPEEHEFDAQTAAESVGLEFHQVPVPKGRPFSKDAFDEIERIVAEASGRTVYLYCGSGNRASAWLAVHLVQRHGLSQGDAFAVAERTGLTKEPLRKMVEAYLGGPTEVGGGEESP